MPICELMCKSTEKDGGYEIHGEKKLETPNEVIDAGRCG